MYTVSVSRPIPMVTLITDFGGRDGYVGIMKAVMLKLCKHIQTIDISHEIPPYDIRSAAFVLGQSYNYFPLDTLHVIVIDPKVGSDRRILYVEAGDYRFLAPENAVLQYIYDREDVHRAIEVKNQDYFLPELSGTFHGRDIFAPVAAHLANGLDPGELGGRLPTFDKILPPKPVFDGNTLRGEIVYIDHYGNMVSNISESMVADLKSGRMNFRILIAEREIRELSNSFYLNQSGDLLAYIDSSSFLAFAIYGQNSAEKLGLSIGDRVEVDMR